MFLAQFVQGLTLSIVAVCAFIVIGLILTAMILYTKKKLVRTALCTITINEDATLTKTVEGGQTLLSALTTEGVRSRHLAEEKLHANSVGCKF